MKQAGMSKINTATDLAILIRAERLRQKLTAEELAKKSGTYINLIYHLENGRLPPFQRIDSILNVLGLSDRKEECYRVYYLISKEKLDRKIRAHDLSRG